MPDRAVRIRSVLQRNLVWYPPDLISAVEEGRTTYVNLAGETYAVREVARANILTAIGTVERGEDDPDYVKALNREAGEDLALQRQESKPKKHKPSPKKRR